jgi:transposase
MLLLKTKYTTPSIMQRLVTYLSAKFEMAAEETEKKTVYASDDRDAANEALKQLKDAYEKALNLSSPQVAENVRGRVSQRIRELDNAFTALEESAQAD